MALHLNGLKAKRGLMDLRNKRTKSGLWELIFGAIPFLEKNRGEKGRKS